MKGRGKRCTRRELKEKIKMLEGQNALYDVALQIATFQINVMQQSFNARLVQERSRFNEGGIVPSKECGCVVELNTHEVSCLTKEQEQSLIALKEGLDAEFGTYKKTLHVRTCS